MYRRLIVLLFLIMTPFIVRASVIDIQILSSNLSLSEEVLIAGDSIRIYASIDNVGDEDVAGYISFFQGSVPIGNSQVISVLAGGNPEEVYVDFVVPSGNFNIRAIIQGTDPVDPHIDNNVAITGMFEPIIDNDRDEISNINDNCIDVANPDQNDNDGDGFGDVCDDDDDNDGLTDEVENEIGSNSLSRDSDGDGVDDMDDAFPNDPNQTKFIPVVQPEPEPKTEPKLDQVKDLAEINNNAIVDDNNDTAVLMEQIVETITKEINDQDLDNNKEDLTLNVDLSDKNGKEIMSPNAVFKLTRNSYNTYIFSVLGPEISGYVYEWDFGDGVKSSRKKSTHTFKSAGTYNVLLSVLSGDGSVASESVTVLIPFFTLQNKVVLIAMLVLIIMLLIGITIMFSVGKKIKNEVLLDEVIEENEIKVNKKKVVTQKTKKVRKINVIEED